MREMGGEVPTYATVATPAVPLGHISELLSGLDSHLAVVLTEEAAPKALPSRETSVAVAAPSTLSHQAFAGSSKQPRAKPDRRARADEEGLSSWMWRTGA